MSAHGASLRVVVADDDPVSRVVLARSVERLGHVTHVAEDGASAWDLVRRHDADVLVTDWRMPGLDGMDLCRLVREAESEGGGYCYIVLLTASSDHAGRRAAMEAGADDFLGKPIAVDELAGRLVAAARVTTLHRERAEAEARVGLLADAARAANEAPDLRSAARAVLAELCVLGRWDVGHLYEASRDDPSTLLPTDVWVGHPESFPAFTASTEATPFARGVGFIGAAARSSGPVWFASDAPVGPPMPRRDAALGEGLIAALAFPVVVAGEAVAVLELHGREPVDPGRGIAGVLEAVAAQLARVVERERAAAALKASEARFRALVQNASDMILCLDGHAQVTYVSPACERFLGLPEGQMGELRRDVLHPADLDAARQVFSDAVRSGGAPPPIHLRVFVADGSERVVEVIATNLLDDPAVGAVVLNARDITERKRSEDRLKLAEERFRRAFDDSPIGMAMVALDGSFIRVNPAACTLLGRTCDELLASSFHDITHVDDREVGRRAMQALVDGHVPSVRLEKRYVRPDGSFVWVELNASVLRDDEGAAVHFVAQAVDISDRKRSEAELAHRATHDPLTGLANRSLFRDHLAVAVARATRRRTPFAVLYLDVDRFKALNDHRGHAAGDAVLIAMAGRLRSALRPSDTAARIGGDEFVVLCEDITGVEDARAIAERLAIDLGRPMAVDGQEVTCGVSIGLAVSSGEGSPTPDDVLRAADGAMYRVKARRRGMGGEAGEAVANSVVTVVCC